jgi:3-oxoacid CoA-transferase
LEAENIVPIGSISPNAIHLPSIYVDRIVRATSEKRIEYVTLAPETSSTDSTKKTDTQLSTRDRIAKRAAKEIKDGFHVS